MSKHRAKIIHICLGPYNDNCLPNAARIECASFELKDSSGCEFKAYFGPILELYYSFLVSQFVNWPHSVNVNFTSI